MQYIIGKAPTLSMGEDVIFWNIVASENFSLKSVWESVRLMVGQLHILQSLRF